jgi:hypothetical protein
MPKYFMFFLYPNRAVRGCNLYLLLKIATKQIMWLNAKYMKNETWQFWVHALLKISQIFGTSLFFFIAGKE